MSPSQPPGTSPRNGTTSRSASSPQTTSRRFAEELVISLRTVQNHLTRIHEKTGLRRRSELTRWAVEHAISS
jgi:DNA-binding CsgD family transcriptional regulator